jgi:hypothetical protein
MIDSQRRECARRFSLSPKETPDRRNAGTPHSCMSTDNRSSHSTNGKPAQMNIDHLFPSKFLRCVDLNGKPRRVTISAIKRDDVGGEQKVVISFADESKMLICNKTNARSISKALGNETKNWIGRDIVLVPTEVDFRGEMVDAIRVRPAPSQSRPPQMAEALDDLPPDLAV